MDVPPPRLGVDSKGVFAIMLVAQERPHAGAQIALDYPNSIPVAPIEWRSP